MKTIDLINKLQKCRPDDEVAGYLQEEEGSFLDIFSTIAKIQPMYDVIEVCTDISETAIFLKKVDD